MDELSDETKEAMVNEIRILKILDHPNILHIYEHFRQKNQFNIIFRLCKGGELFDELLNKGALSEKKT